jgi:hypothetical protein
MLFPSPRTKYFDKNRNAAETKWRNRDLFRRYCGEILSIKMAKEFFRETQYICLKYIE